MLKRFFASRPHLYRIVLPLTILLFLSGGSLVYWKSSSVRLTVDGKTRRIFTKAPDLKTFFDQEHITLGPYDIVTPPRDTLIRHNTAADITRVSTETLVNVSTGPAVVRWQTQNRLNLRRVLVQKGFANITTATYKITRHNGAEAEREILKTKRVKKYFFTLTLFNKQSQPIQVYNLMKAKKLYVRTTGYYVGEKTVPGTVTYLGYKLQRGLVAVDPKVIPLRTRMYVAGYGYAYAADTGSAIKGLHIDLAVKDRREEARYNRHNVVVYILEKARKW